jgi:hypothetical protein
MTALFIARTRLKKAVVKNVLLPVALTARNSLIPQTIVLQINRIGKPTGNHAVMKMLRESVPKAEMVTENHAGKMVPENVLKAEMVTENRAGKMVPENVLKAEMVTENRAGKMVPENVPRAETVKKKHDAMMAQRNVFPTGKNVTATENPAEKAVLPAGNSVNTVPVKEKENWENMLPEKCR